MHYGVYHIAFILSNCTCNDGTILKDNEWRKITGKELADMLKYKK
jgi:hypothetical protein